MSLHETHNRILDPDQSQPLIKCCRAFLWPLSKVYEALACFRNFLYDKRLLKQTVLSVPVISVGNLTAGGTGKTPLVIWMARNLNFCGWKPAVLSRGYGNTGCSLNDENTLITRQLPNIPVIENPDRAAAAELAIKQRSDVIILDDGFQHRKIARQVEILTVDATNPFGGEQLLPLGFLREHPSRLSEADMIVLTRTDLVSPDELKEAESKIRFFAPNMPILHSVHLPVGLAPADDGRKENSSVMSDLHNLKNGRWAAFCAIGNPRAFRKTLDNCGAEICLFRSFRDHHHYNESDIKEIEQQALDNGCDFIVTTEKDAVKIKGGNLTSGRFPIFYLKIEMEISNGEKIIEYIDTELKKDD